MATIKRYTEENLLLKEDLQQASEKTYALHKALMNAGAVIEQLRKTKEEISNGHQGVAVVERDHSFEKVFEEASEALVQPTPSRKRVSFTSV